MNFEEFFENHQQTLRLIETRKAAEIVWTAAILAAEQALLKRGQHVDQYEALDRVRALHLEQPVGPADLKGGTGR